MENVIRHDGIIEKMEHGHVLVRIMQSSACAECKVATHCNIAEQREKLIDVAVADASRWHVGQKVAVTTQLHMAGKALLLGFGLPLILMLMVLAVCMAAGCSEGLTAVFMLSALVPYYAVIGLLRSRISRTISFNIVDSHSEE